MIKSGLALPPPLYLPVGVKSARTRSVAAGSALFYDGYPPNGTKIYDHSGNGNDGSITGATWVRQKSGLWVLKFNGADQRVTIATSASLRITTSITWSVWLNPTTLGNREWCANDAPGRAYYLKLANNGMCGIVILTDAGNSDVVNVDGIGNYVAGVWQMLTITYLGVADATSVMTLYRNGTQVKQNTTCHWPLRGPAQTIYLGIYPDLSEEYVGLMGLPTIIPGAQTPAQVAQAYARDKWLFGL